MAETGLAPVYRYYTADLLTDRILAEIPFRGVSYERAIKSAGQFSGSIPVINATKSMDIYESTMPGNTALYVVRNGVCVWGGIIWARSYNVVDRVLNVSASEFTSYFYHRRIWKSWNHAYGATLTVSGDTVSGTLTNGSGTSALLPGASVMFSFDAAENQKYDGYYKISSTPVPTSTTFTVDNTQSVATVNVVSRAGNIVTAITDSAHTLAVNDTITLDIPGTGSEFSGTHVVLSVGGTENTVFTFALAGVDTAETQVTGTVSRPIPDGTYELTTVTVRADTYDYIRSMVRSVFDDFVGIDFPNTYIEPGIGYNFEIINKEIERGVATLQTASAHDLAPGQAVQVKNVGPEFDGEYYVTETRADDEFSYAKGGTLASTPVVVNEQSIERISATDGVVTVTTLQPHGMLANQTVDILTGIAEGGVSEMLNGTFTISEILSTTKFKYSSGYLTTIPEIVFDPANALSMSRTNLVENPSFEVGLTGWTSTGTLTRVTSQFFYGTASGSVVCTAQNQKLTSASFTASASTAYTGSVYVKGEAGKAVSLTLTDSASTVGTSGSITLDGTWQRISAKVVTAAGATTVRLDVTNLTNGAHTFYVDAALLEKSATLSPYFDGTTTDTYSYAYEWSGTAHASASRQLHNLDIITASIASNVVTLTATEPPDFFVGQSAVISGVYPQLALTQKSFDAANSKATVTTAAAHNLQVGDTVGITGLRDYSSLSARQVSGTTVTFYTNQSHNIFIGDTVQITDLKDIYTITKKALSANVVTLSTNVAHNVQVGSEIIVENIYDTYPVVGKVLTDGVATLTLTVPVGGGHNFAVNDSVSIAGIDDEANVVSKVVENKIATLTTDFPHNFLENDEVTISGLGAPFDGKFTIIAFTGTRIQYQIESDTISEIPLTAAVGTITGTRGAFNGDFTISAVTANTISFNKTGNNVLASAVSGGVVVGLSPMNGTYTVTSTPTTNKFTYALTGYAVTETDVIPASDDVTLTPQASVDSIHLGTRTVTGVTRNTFTFTQSGLQAVTLQNVSGIVNVNSIFNGTRTITAKTDQTLSFSLTAPNNILETPANSLAYLTAPGIYNGTFTITAVDPDLNTISYAKSHIDMTPTAIQGYGSATVNPLAVVSTFGPFPGNSDIGIEFSTKDYSGTDVSPTAYRGFELTNVGDALSSYSDTLDGFEYRIDCSYDVELGQFKKTFVLLPINLPNPPAEGELSPLSRFGADKLVFEYPGNIINLSIEESAENASTRFFAVGENDLGPDAGPPFSVASANGLLRGVDSVRRWPLLDDDEKVSDVDDENILYAYATRYLNEVRPPDAKLTLEVNGSLQPLVGSYAPGDWCALVVDDEFILERLRSDMEPRDTVIVRKIDIVKVSVPDGTTFPEKVSLTLVPEWEVDAVG